MHELTLANSLVELASDHAQRSGALRVSSITIRLGVLCGISRSLYFCFEPASRGTACEGASLTIIESPLSVFCANCNEAKTPRALFNLRCPDCGRPTPKVLTGREMDLVSIEIEGALGPRSSEESPSHEQEVRPTMRTVL
jgi:hydrogenase nickel incorporation protein HypA/HybF